MIQIKIRNESSNDLPGYSTMDSAGMDLRANLLAPVTINPLERAIIPTGLFMEIPKGYEGQIRPRSGLAAKSGITVLNTPGTIDADYRGEIKIILINLSNEPFLINHGERIAQIIFAAYTKATFLVSGDLEETSRGAGGFGHTGK